MHHVLNDVYHVDARFFWHGDGIPNDIDAVILPGGFSYGDRLRPGIIAAHSPIINEIRRLSDRRVPILNGFQILVEAGLLPGALLKNTSLRFMCKWTSLVVENNTTPFTNKLELNQEIPIPVANGDGRYFVDEQTFADLKKHNQIVFRYKEDVNGSSYNIAGICNKEGNVVGMMPHPERAAEKDINPINNKPASLIFESLINTLEVRN